MHIQGRFLRGPLSQLGAPRLILRRNRVILKMSGFYPTLNFGHFWATLLEMSGFYTTRKYDQFWAHPAFSAFRSTFVAEEEAKNLDFLPHPKFWPFLGRPLKDVRFYPARNFGHFLASLPGHPFDLPKCH